jgi:hypothetical protein
MSAGGVPVGLVDLTAGTPPVVIVGLVVAGLAGFGTGEVNVPVDLRGRRSGDLPPAPAFPPFAVALALAVGGGAPSCAMLRDPSAPPARAPTAPPGWGGGLSSGDDRSETAPDG